MAETYNIQNIHVCSKCGEVDYSHNMVTDEPSYDGGAYGKSYHHINCKRAA